ncbi:hypothetical protein NRIC_28420 [Enterococcus florum]|uniref:Uncharacterized protein n=1 Tax=Enterococcus florum TaxID=2480627 RepID=A0A4P5PF12_9ENTE|nr:hypothetical protein [Enterococcus florum]GCF94951.1 hypothetical protein NRIC_28420 [Enterococcus florum]
MIRKRLSQSQSLTKNGRSSTGWAKPYEKIEECIWVGFEAIDKTSLIRLDLKNGRVAAIGYE